MNRLLWRALAGAAISAVAVTSAVTVAGTAQAAFTDCKNGEFCIYLNEDGTGKWASFKSGTLDLSVQGLAQAKSAINKTGQTVRLYENAGINGPSEPVGADKKSGFSLGDVNGHDLRGKVKSVQVGSWDPKSAGPAPAGKTATSAGYERCKDGEFCLFAGENGTGSHGTFRNGADDLTKFGLDGTAKSVWNRTKFQVQLFSGKTRAGESKTITSTEQTNLKDLGWADKTKSVRVTDQALATAKTTSQLPPTSTPPAAALTSNTQCMKSQRGDSTCARYGQRDGGVVDIEYKSVLNRYAATTFKGEVAHEGGARIGEGRTESRTEGIFRTTVKVGKDLTAGKRLCAKVLEVKPGNREWGEVCIQLRADDTPKPGMAEPAANNPAAWPCEPSSFCVYANYNGAGSHWALKDGADLAAITGMLDNHVFSVKNIDNEDWCLYEDKDQNTKVTVVPAGHSYNLKVDQAKRISSVDDDC